MRVPKLISSFIHIVTAASSRAASNFVQTPFMFSSALSKVIDSHQMMCIYTFHLPTSDGDIILMDFFEKNGQTNSCKAVDGKYAAISRDSKMGSLPAPQRRMLFSAIRTSRMKNCSHVSFNE